MPSSGCVNFDAAQTLKFRTHDSELDHILFLSCMLPRAQPPRLLISCRLQWQVRRITTTAAGTKRYRQESSTFAADRLKLPVLKTPEQSAYVKTGRFLESPAQALAVIRALERKYGAVNEYHIAKVRLWCIFLAVTQSTLTFMNLGLRVRDTISIYNLPSI